MWFATLWLTTVDVTEKQKPVWVSDGIEVRTINGPSWGRTSDQSGRVDKRSEMLMRKREHLHEASDPCHVVRNRPGVTAHIHPCGQSDCPDFHPSAHLVQGRRRLDRPADL